MEHCVILHVALIVKAGSERLPERLIIVRINTTSPV